MFVRKVYNKFVLFFKCMQTNNEKHANKNLKFKVFVKLLSWKLSFSKEKKKMQKSGKKSLTGKKFKVMQILLIKLVSWIIAS